MSVIKELKAFMMRGNVVDMAVGVVVGGAFGQIVTSLVNDIVMPPIGVLLNGISFTDLKVTIKHASTSTAGEVIPAVTINYGNFVQVVINFVIIATAIFFVIKGMNAMQKKKVEEPKSPPAPSKEEVLLSEIRDILKQQNNK